MKNAVASPPQHRLRHSRQVSDKEEAKDELQTLKSRLTALESGMRSHVEGGDNRESLQGTGTSPSVRREGRFEECTYSVQRTAFYGIWECPAG